MIIKRTLDWFVPVPPCTRGHAHEKKAALQAAFRA